MTAIAATAVVLMLLYVLYWSPGARHWVIFLLRMVPGTLWWMLVAFVAGMCTVESHAGKVH